MLDARPATGGTRVWIFAVCALVAPAFAGPGCQQKSQSLTSMEPCEVSVPCKDDPSKTCKEPCKSPSTGPGMSPAGPGGGGSGGSAGTGGFGGSADVVGQVVQFTSTAFDDIASYKDPITIIAPGVDTKTVEADTVNGNFSLTGAATGAQWLLAKDGNGGTGGAFSTFSLQLIDGTTALGVPVVPVDILDAVGTQIGVQSLTTGRAHVVLQITDEMGSPIEGVNVLGLSGSTVGYDIGLGEYSSFSGATGNEGMAVILNAVVAGPGTVTLSMFFDGTPIDVSVPIAPDTVTWAPVGVDLTP